MSLNCELGSIISHMVIDMDETRLQTISQLQVFLGGTVEVLFRVPDNDEARYAHIVSVAQCFGYARLNRPDKGVVLRYLIATCGYGRAQLTRLLARVLDGQSLYKRATVLQPTRLRGATPRLMHCCWPRWTGRTNA